MKKLLNISFLLAVLCFAAPAFAEEGDMPTGSKGCKQNCALYNGTTPDSTGSIDKKQEDSTIEEIYSWIYEQISELVD